MKTYLRVNKGGAALEAATIANYLPDNYEVAGEDANYVYVVGEDNAGWTADGYVIPRLMSGMYWAEKINQATYVAGTRPGE